MFILFDIGGTKMRIARSRDGEHFDEPIVLETPGDFEDGISLLKQTADKLCKGEKLEIAVGGIAGPLDKKHTIMVASPNIGGWAGKPIKTALEETLGTRVIIENDAALVGLGEAHAGAGREYDIVAYMTVSTGIGGALIVDGRIGRNRFGFEPGHQIIDLDKSACPECASDLEGYVSGAALEKRTGEKPYDIEDADIWEELAEWLACGLNNTIVHWSPDVVVLGGAMIVGRPSISVERVEEHLKRILTIFPECPEIKKAELVDFGGLHGALVLLRQQ